MQAIDIGDDDYLGEVEPIVDDFERLWLEHFIAGEDAISLITGLRSPMGAGSRSSQ